MDWRRPWERHLCPQALTPYWVRDPVEMFLMRNFTVTREAACEWEACFASLSMEQAWAA